MSTSAAAWPPLRQVFLSLDDDRPRLALRTGDPAPVDEARASDPPARPFVLVHGLASNARLWDAVTNRLLAAGHPVVAVDQRGHGLSERPDAGYDTGTCADDLAAVIGALGFTGASTPVVVGQSWGANVVLSMAARYPNAAEAVCCVDGGWIRLADAFATFEQCWEALAPPQFDDLRLAQIVKWLRSAHPDWAEESIAGTLANLEEHPDGTVRARLAREHHRSIVHSLYLDDPSSWYPQVAAPVLLCPAVSSDPLDAQTAAKRAAIQRALDTLPNAEVSWYVDADHDLHAQHPDRLAAELLELAGGV